MCGAAKSKFLSIQPEKSSAKPLKISRLAWKVEVRRSRV